MSAEYDKRTIAMVLGLLFPGAGHILIDRVRRGIKIAIVFVIVSYASGVILNNILNTQYIQDMIPLENREIFYQLSALSFIPTFALWLFQIFDLSKIISQVPIAEGKAMSRV